MMLSPPCSLPFLLFHATSINPFSTSFPNLCLIAAALLGYSRKYTWASTHTVGGGVNYSPLRKGDWFLGGGRVRVTL